MCEDCLKFIVFSIFVYYVQCIFAFFFQVVMKVNILEVMCFSEIYLKKQCLLITITIA